MIDSKIIIAVAIVVIIGAIAAGYQMNSNPPALFKSLKPNIDDSGGKDTGGKGTGAGSSPGGGTGGASSTPSSSGSSGSSGGVNGYSISPSEAQNIAQQYITEEGAVAGTPRLINMDGKPVYVVPIEINGTIVGEIYIDPETGENIGGSGGAPG